MRLSSASSRSTRSVRTGEAATMVPSCSGLVSLSVPLVRLLNHDNSQRRHGNLPARVQEAPHDDHRALGDVHRRAGACKRRRLRLTGGAHPHLRHAVCGARRSAGRGHRPGHETGLLARRVRRGVGPRATSPNDAPARRVVGLRRDPVYRDRRHPHAVVHDARLGGRPDRIRDGDLTSRWFTLGCAVQSATLACLAAACGMEGDVSLLDGRWSEITGVRLDATLLTRGLGERFHICEVSFKPICSAKQATAATYALRSLLAEGTKPSEIARVLVEVPAAYAKMIDQPELPGNRLASIANVRYQLALAAYAPERLSDAVRERLLANDQIAAFVEKIEVRADPELERYYPRAYPARVTLTLGSGAEKSREIRDAPGDPGTGFGWDEVAAKYPMLPSAVRDACSALGERGSVDALFQALAGAFGVATPRD